MELISIRQACQRLSIGRTTLWRMTIQTDFPKPIEVSAGRKAFVESEIEAWIQGRIAERDEVAA